MSTPDFVPDFGDCIWFSDDPDRPPVGEDSPMGCPRKDVP